MGKEKIRLVCCDLISLMQGMCRTWCTFDAASLSPLSHITCFLFLKDQATHSLSSCATHVLSLSLFFLLPSLAVPYHLHMHSLGLNTTQLTSLHHFYKHVLLDKSIWEEIERIRELNWSCYFLRDLVLIFE